MTIALIDNGSLEPTAHRNLRAIAAALTQRLGRTVEPVSWKHSDQIPAAALEGVGAATLEPWLRTKRLRGEREFVFVPFVISAQGAIASAIRADLARLRHELGDFSVVLTEGVATAVPAIVAARVRETIAHRGLKRPPVIVVDHGGPAPASAVLRNQLAAAIAAELATEITRLAPASMEGSEYAHNDPMLIDQLAAPGFDRGDVVIAPLFLSPGRHAAPNGDLAQIARAAEDRLATARRDAAPALRCHFTGLVGTHPLAIDALAAALQQTLSSFHAAA